MCRAGIAIGDGMKCPEMSNCDIRTGICREKGCSGGRQEGMMLRYQAVGQSGTEQGKQNKQPTE